ncbi:ankyrin repeat-containing domain protein [Aspergillus egyptiacus]|nr:ankyrin repeat-containing domain protein [Aspergillus egyptiacus]
MPISVDIANSSVQVRSGNSDYFKTDVAVFALRIAVETNNVAAVEMLLSQAVDPTDIDSVSVEESILFADSPLRTYPLFNAANRGHIEVVRLLFRYYGDLMRSKRAGTWEPAEVRLFALYLAVTSGHADIVFYLCFGAPRKVFLPAHMGPVLFYHAVRSGSRKVVRLLHSLQQALNRQTAKSLPAQNEYRGYCLLQHSHNFIYCIWPQELMAVHLVALAYRECDTASPFYRCTVDMMQFLLENGANLHSLDMDRRTVLHIAAGTGDIALVIYLLKCGADINAADVHGRTPLMHAALQRRSSMVQLLLKWGADINLANKSGRTALHIAVLRKDSPSIPLLVKHGANPEAVDCFGQTPFHMAISNSVVWVNEQFTDALKTYDWFQSVQKRT